LDKIALNVVNAVSSTPISVSWLSDTAHVDEILLSRLNPNRVNHLPSDALVANKNYGHMGVAKKADGRALISEARGGLEVIKNVTPLGWCIERRVHDRKIAHLLLVRQITEPLLVLFCQFVARPLDGALGQFVKVGR
jgi:hypothetical protein